MSRSRSRFAAVCMAFVLVVAGCSAAGSSDEGNQLPDLSLVTITDGASDLDLRETGRDRVLNLWAIWCAPCREELPVFDEVAGLSDSVDVIGINVGDSEADAQSLVDELGLTFQQVLDPASRVRTELRITGMPATIFVSASGDVVSIHNGEVDRSELIELINQHFNTELS